MKQRLLALPILLIICCVLKPTPETRVLFVTATPQTVTETRVPTETLTQTPTQPPTQSRTPTGTPRPTEQPTPSPKATKVWRGRTFLVETTNLLIYYPDVIDQDEARKHADILQKAYDTYLGLFGNEPPFGGKKIAIIWDPQLTGGASAGNPITMCGRCPLMFSSLPGEVNPPGAGFYHELVHDFTNASSSRASRYISLNVAMSEAFATYFAYYFGHEVLRYSKADIAAYEEIRATELQALAQYESSGASPYSVAWTDNSSPKFYFMGMLFRISDQCGWGVWQRFFAIALDSGNPGLSPDDVDRYGDMNLPVPKKAFADFVAFLGQACGQDLRPMFRNWRFDLP